MAKIPQDCRNTAQALIQLKNYCGRLPGILLLAWLTACNGDGSPKSSDPAQLVELNGRVEYMDRMYTTTGFIEGNEPFKPLRFVYIDLIDFSQTVVETTTTDDNGNYSFTAQPEGAYTLRVLAETDPESGFLVQVSRQSGELYSTTLALDLDAAASDAPVDVSITLDSRLAGVFNILDVMVNAQAYVKSFTGNPLTLPLLNAFWTRGRGPGTYTCSGFDSGLCLQGEGVYVLGGFDSDEFDDDVLWHEFAHYLEYSLGQLDSPGGGHLLTENTLDLRLAWSEGHADYLQAAIKQWLLDTEPRRLSIPTGLETTRYVDTEGPGVSISLDFADSSSFPFCPDCYRYSSSEAAIAKVLLAIEQQSSLALSLKVLTGPLTGNATADTFEAYWDGLLNNENPDFSTWSGWQQILIERSIFYRLDEFENDDDSSAPAVRTIDCRAPPPATCIDAETHYLFRDIESMDADRISLLLSAGINYCIYTHDLGNGADTLLTLLQDDANPALDNSGRPIENDDDFDCEITGSCVLDSFTGVTPYHNGSNLASALDFTLDQSATYTLEITTAPHVFQDSDVFGYIGRYGSYALTVKAVITPCNDIS
jgi:hypothetical protein